MILLTMIALTAIGAIRVNKINNALTLINDVDGVKERYAINFRGSVHDRAIAVRDVTRLSHREGRSLGAIPQGAQLAQHEEGALLDGPKPSRERDQ